MSIVACFQTCGRRDYLAETIASFDAQVSGDITRVVVFDDSGDRAFQEWLTGECDRRGWSLASWGSNRGYTAAMRLAWMWLTRHAVESHVFWCEEDFTFDVPVCLDDLVPVLDGNAHLDQVALLRHAYYPREIAAGGIIEEHPEAYARREDGDGRVWLEHDLYFTANPSVFRRELCETNWAKGRSSERVFTSNRVAAGQRFAYWGDGSPQVTHIGAVKKGHSW